MHFCMMLEKLQKKWGVRGWRFFLILCTFAVTGTFTAWVSKGITGWLDVEKYSATWWALKCFVLIIGYQLLILAFGFCFGQFAFFWKFEKRLLTSLGIIRKLKVARIAIFASGTGSNAEKILSTFTREQEIKVELIVSNKEDAGVLRIAKNYNVETHLLKKGLEYESELLSILTKKNITHLILAGYLWKVPDAFIRSFPERIINIHPALLPKFGGKGMYGMRVHEAVIEAGERESGITIHYVDEVYDNGEIIFQARIQLSPGESPQSLAAKIQTLEHKHFPEVIRSAVKAKSTLKEGESKSRVENLV